MAESLYKRIPSIESLLADREVKQRFRAYSRKMLLEALRETAARWRYEISKGQSQKNHLSREFFLSEVAENLKLKQKQNLRKVINATGVVLNTNLGRAPLATSAGRVLSELSSGYSNLEIELKSGERGERYSHIEALLKNVTGAESALVVNNNAAAVLLVLDAFAKGKEVIVSRGELIEIGGSFRLPEVLEKSGAKLVEVGTTNRTYLSDYEKAINENTALLLRSHTSNYRISGFVYRPPVNELVELGRKYSLLSVEDLGSGLLIDLTKFGLPYEPTVGDAVKSGLDLVTFSGDKLLGGPQSGIILGREELINRMKQNPLLRAFRVCKFTLGALEAVLRIYSYEADPVSELPHLRMITEPLTSIQERANQLAQKLTAAVGDSVTIEVIAGESEIGGGSYPDVQVPTYLMSLRCRGKSPEQIAGILREGEPPIIARITNDRVVLDMRTIREEEAADVVKVIKDKFA